MKFDVEKWHGAGNDFVVLDGRELAAAPDWPAWTRFVCDRRRGIGADGILVLESDAELDCRMHYRNADGSEAEMCGNGGRVLAAFATARGLGREAAVRFRSRWGAHEATVRPLAEDRYLVSLTLPDIPSPRVIELDAPWGGRVRGLLVHAGVPHLVISLDETPVRRLEEAPLAAWGPVLRRSQELGAAGANVDLLTAPQEGVLGLRTFERGVEGETLACGTGATAAAAAAIHWGWGELPASVRVASGDVLDVRASRRGGSLTEVVLVGPVVRVFRTQFPNS
jgi:diaminopimelate epimerase